MIIDLILIQLIIVFLIDLSGAITSLKLFISKYLTRGKIVSSDFSLKPFDCSLCMTHWCCLLYLIIFKELSLVTYSITCVLAFFSPITNDILLSMKDLMYFIINKISNIWLKTNMD